MLQPLEAVLAALVVALGVALGASARERRRLRQRLMRAWVREHGATKVARAERQRGDALAARLALVESKALALREVAHAVAIAAQLDATGITGALWLILFVIGCIIPGPCEIAFRLYMYTCMTHRAELYTRYGRTYTQRCSTLA